MTVKPIGKRVLLKVVQKEEKSSGGIYIPASAQEKTHEGFVIDLGDTIEKSVIKPGDRVIYDKYAGTQVTINDEEHLILKIEDILGIIS